MNPAVQPNAAQAPVATAHVGLAGPFALVWAIAWAAVGCAVAGGIVLLSDLEFGPAVQISILFAELVGFTALVSARLVFPLFVRLPLALALPLQVLTVFSGTVFGSITVAAVFPLLSLREFRLLALLILTNAVIAGIVGVVIYTYDAMRRQIEHSFRELRRKEALERELSIARDVQQQLLPGAPPVIEGLELAGVCIPAVGVGGDYYDFLHLAERQAGLVVADVSGKGVPAALLMAGLQASVRSLTRPGTAPDEIVARLNDFLYASSSAARYATLFLGIYDTVGRTIDYTNAGHHPPLILGTGGTRKMDAGGMPIGLFPGTSYTAGRLQLGPGDMIVLFTDGVVEAPDRHGEEFGAERLLAVLTRHGGRPLEEILSGVLAALAEWTGEVEAHDDVTLVLARTR